MFGYQVADVLTRGVGTWRSGDFQYTLPRSYTTSFNASGAGGVATISVDRAHIGGPAKLRFSVYGYWFVQPIRNYYWDSAPSAQGGLFAYDLGRHKPSSPRGSRSRRRPERPGSLPPGGCVLRLQQERLHGPVPSNAPGSEVPGARILVPRRDGLCPDPEPPGGRARRGALPQRLPGHTATDRARADRRSDAVAGAKLGRGAVLEIRALKPGWIGYDARIEIRGSPLSTHLTEKCLPAMGERVALPCGRVERGS